MGTTCNVWMMCAVLMVSTTSAAYYNENKLALYTRLSQQLRYQIASQLATIVARGTNMMTARSTAQSLLNQRVLEMNQYFYQMDEVVDTLSLKAGIQPMIALKVRTSDPYPYTMHAIFWNTVEWSHGFRYTTSNGDAVIPKTGVYMIEYHLHEIPITYMKVKLTIVRPDGTTRYSYTHHVAWGQSPLFQTLNLYAGDRLDTVTMGQSGNLYWVYQGNRITVVPGISNQMTVRYVGKIPN